MAEAENGGLSFLVNVDTANANKTIDEFKGKIQEIGTEAKASGENIDASLNNSATASKASAQKVVDNLKGIAQQKSAVDKAFERGFNIPTKSFEEIKSNIRTQQEYVRNLEVEYNKAAKAVEKMSPGIAQDKARAALAPMKQEIAEEKAALDGLKAKYDDLKIEKEKQRQQDKAGGQEQVTRVLTIKGQITQITNQLAQMRLDGKKNTDEYKQLEKTLAEVATKYREVARGKALDSSGATQIQGLMQGLQGLMGAYTAASGVMGMFVKDQEQLMKVQAKMQSMMAILMGMQQVANALHSTSTFRLRTVAKAQELWTLAINKTKVALTTGTAAARAFKIALATTGVGLLVIALGALVSAISKMKAQAKEAEAQLKALQKSLDIKFAGLAEMQRAERDIMIYQQALKRTNMTEAETLRLINELNSKYGSLLAKYKTKAEWLDALTKGQEKYNNAIKLQAQLEEAKRQQDAAAERKVAAEKKQGELWQEARNMNSGKFFQRTWKRLAHPFLGEQIDSNVEEVNAATQELSEATAEYERYKTELDKALDELSNASGSSEMEAIRKQGEDIKNARADLLKDITANEIAIMQDGKNKKLAEIEAERVEQLAAIDKQRKDIEAKLKEAGKGGLSQDDKQNFATKEKQVNAAATKKIEAVEKENAAQIAKLYKQVGDVFITEEQRKLNAIKERYAEMRKQLKEQKEGGTITETQYVELSANVDIAEAKETADYWLSAYGNYDQQRKALDEQWKQNLANIPPEYMDGAVKQMQKALSELDLAKFKETMDWEGVFGNLAEQSSQAIQYNLSQVVAYFEANKDKMGVDEIKDMQKAISDLNSELSGRNPFYGLLNSLDELKSNKADYVAAMQEIKTAKDELKAADDERKEASDEVADLEHIILVGEADLETNDKLEAAKNRLSKATENVGKKQEKLNTATKKGVAEQSKMASSYRKFTTNLSAVGGAISGLAGQASKLARVFSDEVADGIDTAISMLDTLIDATTSIINVVGDTSKKVVSAVEDTTEGASKGMEAAAGAAGASIKAVESASVILTIISAALQVATAIASLFGNGDKKVDERIEALQNEIDQLQWEVQNAEANKLAREQNILGKIADAKQKAEATLIAAGKKGSDKDFGIEAAKIAAEDLNKEFAKIGYTASKSSGADFYKEAAEAAKNYANQIELIEQQKKEEQGKKKPDQEKVKEYENQQKELAQSAADAYNEKLEEVVGGSADSIAETLGDAFIEAFAAGEDAVAAWGQAVDKIIADIIKKMLIQMFIKDKIAASINDFGEAIRNEDGSIDATKIQAAAEKLEDDLKQTGDDFRAVMDNEKMKEIFDVSADRQAAEKGIASISQESADEMNGRMTAIQSHTYSINENTKILVQNSAAILESVIDIKENTDTMKQAMNEMRDDIAKTRKAVADIKQDGVKMK